MHAFQHMRQWANWPHTRSRRPHYFCFSFHFLMCLTHTDTHTHSPNELTAIPCLFFLRFVYQCATCAEQIIIGREVCGEFCATHWKLKTKRRIKKKYIYKKNNGRQAHQNRFFVFFSAPICVHFDSHHEHLGIEFVVIIENKLICKR